MASRKTVQPEAVRPETRVARCHRCGAERPVKPSKHDRGYNLPRSWHDQADGAYAGIWCKACWQSSFVPRSITIPVSGPVAGDWRDAPGDPTWPGLRKALDRCWGWSTAVANWYTTELARWDTPRTADATRLGPDPTRNNPYLYGGVEAVAPGMDSQAKIAVMNTVLRSYVARRFEVLWSRRASFPAYRYPYPYAVDRDGWMPAQDPKDGRPCIQVRLAGERWVLRLAGGFRNRRKIDGWKRILSGEAIRREIAIDAVGVTASDHRGGTGRKAPGGGQRKAQRVVVRIAAWFPRKEADQEPANVMECKTTPDSFLSYRVGGHGEYRHIYGDHVRRWRNQYAGRSRRFAHDLKREKRWPSGVRRAMRHKQEEMRVKFADRMNTFLHEATKIVAEHAYRRKVARVILDLRDESFAPEGFPWFKLKQLMKEKLDERRIAVEIVVEGPAAEADVPGVRPAPAPRRPRAERP